VTENCERTKLLMDKGWEKVSEGGQKNGRAPVNDTSVILDHSNCQCPILEWVHAKKKKTPGSVAEGGAKKDREGCKEKTKMQKLIDKM